MTTDQPQTTETRDRAADHQYAVGSRVRLSARGKQTFSKSRRLDRVGIVTKDLGGSSVYVLWDGTAKTAAHINRLFIEAAL